MSATHVISTAGHVDHGKSTLVRALTGTDPDRLAEEKARGLTIDLGFASVQLPSGRTIAIVDVPGHIRFLRNMLAGVGAVDACIFVVAATEGWKPQSEEHLRILELLETQTGVVALTQIDLVDDELVELATMEIEEHVSGTFLEGAPIVPVDSLSGRGLPELSAALDALVDATPQAADIGKPRLWIDRSFAAKGAGTIVTGTLTGGSVAVDDTLLIAPQMNSVRVRGIQSLHTEVESVAPGNRVALNLSGVAHHDVSRGDVLVADGHWHHTSTFDAELQVLASLDHNVSRRGAHVAYIGSGEVPAVVRVLGPEAITPGETSPIRLRIPHKLPLLPGDRFVLRESGRGETIGGGQILDVSPKLRASKAAPDRSVDRVIAEREWVDVDELELLTGERREPMVGRWVVEESALAAMRERLQSAVEESGSLGLELAGLDQYERAVVATVEGVEIDSGRVKLGDIVDPLASHPLIEELMATPFTPPKPDGHDRAEVRELVRRGLIVEEDGIFFAADAIGQAAQRIADMLTTRPDGVTVAEIREELGTSRKYTLPLLARLDTTGMTRRRGDFRIAGPRLPGPTG